MKAIKIFGLIVMALLTCQCSEDETPQPLADFQFLVEGAQVTFNGTIADANSILWDFGDGTTSSEEDPVYAYAAAGTYSVSLTVEGGGGSFTETKSVTILPSLEILLTGGPAKPEGKSWRLKKAYTSGKEGAGMIQDNLALLLPSQDNLLELVGLGNSYEDTFTFVHDGSYRVDNVDDQSLMGLLYANIVHQSNITGVSWDINNVPLAHVLYTPATDATWEISSGDFTVEAATGTVQFTDKDQLILGEYLGFKDMTSLVILKEITEDFMNVAIGIHTEQAVYDKPSLLFHLSFEAL